MLSRVGLKADHFPIPKSLLPLTGESPTPKPSEEVVMQSMHSRKIPISELRSLVTDLSLLHPSLEISSQIDFDLLETFHDLAMNRHFSQDPSHEGR